jgi:hypothetical protein
MSQPRSTRRVPEHRRGRAATSGLVGALLVGVLLVLSAARSTTPAHRTSSGRAGASTTVVPPPGLRPDVEKWFKARQNAQIELNDALVPVVQNKVQKAGASAAPCKRIDRAVRALNAVGRAPHAETDALARAGLDKIGRGAAACLAGDLATARRLISEGLAERADASLLLDEVLEGEDTTTSVG